MIRIAYNFLLSLLWLVKPILMVLNPKFAKRESEWLKVLKNNFEKIENKGTRKTIWIHSASMGEFEQAKPLIEAIKIRYPQFFVLVTFFSPSGYENQKNYPYADVILYLPFDFWWNSKKFINLVKPNIAIFIKYEFWLNFLVGLHKNNVPTYLVAATEPFRFRNSIFYSFFLKYALNYFTKIFVMDEKDLKFFSGLNLKVPLALEFDTRFDRVYSKVQNPDPLPFKKEDLSGDLVLVAGSVWEPDLELIFKAKEDLMSELELKIIYVPHEPTERIIEYIEKNDKNSIRYSKILSLNHLERAESFFFERNIIVDKIGLLLSLYSLADVAYVGGGFGKGLHSIIEPAGYFLPIICGGNISNSKDAINLYEIGALFVVNNPIELVKLLKELKNPEYLLEVSNKVKDYFFKRVGSTQRILNELLMKD
ncbi:MAG: 3-deoxy-D-manno-octulosonic acid transferase [Candidatus Kapaibacteriota bacterium]